MTAPVMRPRTHRRGGRPRRQRLHRPPAPDDGGGHRRGARPAHLGLHAWLPYLRFFTARIPSSAGILRGTGWPAAVPTVARSSCSPSRATGWRASVSYEPADPGEAEVAFLIDDGHHGLGDGHAAARTPGRSGRERGVDRFLAEVLAENHGMLQVFADSGFARRTTMSEPITDLVIDTALSDLTLSQIATKEAPRGGVLAGLSAVSELRRRGRTRRRRAGAGDVLRNLRAAGFTGQTFLVRPSRAPGPRPAPTAGSPMSRGRWIWLWSRPAPPRSLRSPRSAAGQECAPWPSPPHAAAATPSAEARRELVALARRHGTRIDGAGCLGVVNTDPGVSLHAATVRPHAADRWPVSGVAVRRPRVAILDQADRTGLGTYAEFVSLGDKADVSGNDLLLHWWQQPRGGSSGSTWSPSATPASSPASPGPSPRQADPRREERLARQIRKPSSPSPACCAWTHAKLIDVARVLADQPLPQGPRLASSPTPTASARSRPCRGNDRPGAASALRARGMRCARDHADGRPREPRSTSARTTIRPRSGPQSPCSWPRGGRRGRRRPGDRHDRQAARDPRAGVRGTAATPTVPVLATCVSAGEIPGLVAEHDVRLPVFDFELAIRALGHALTYSDWLRREGPAPGADPDGRRRPRSPAAGPRLAQQWAGDAVPPAALRPRSCGCSGSRCWGPTRPTRSRGTVELVIRMRTDPQFRSGSDALPGGPAAAGSAKVRGAVCRSPTSMPRRWSRHCRGHCAGRGRRRSARERLRPSGRHRVALLAEHAPEIAELDLTPVVVGTLGAAVGAVRMHLADAAPAADASCRLS